jgi:predicted ribosome quality control (RQC) complex YloA/Tae2 family protein
MKSYTSFDGITIKVGENAKDNDALTQSSFPNEWWLHTDGGAGSHVVVCYEEDVLPKETKSEMLLYSPHTIVNP